MSWGSTTTPGIREVLRASRGVCPAPWGHAGTQDQPCERTHIAPWRGSPSRVLPCCKAALSPSQPSAGSRGATVTQRDMEVPGVGAEEVWWGGRVVWWGGRVVSWGGGEVWWGGGEVWW